MNLLEARGIGGRFFGVSTIMAFFVLVRSYRSILSLFFLSAYALLLLHDFIPHSHHSHKQVVQVTGEDHHHHGDHHHSHDHSEEKDEDQNTPGASDNSSVLVSLIQTHSHSGFDGHQHNLVYRATAKDNALSKVEVDICHSASQWRLPDRLFNRPVKHQASYWLLSSQFQTSSHGLRAPPALG